MNKNLLYYSVLASNIAFLPSCLDKKQEQAEKPNIIFILADDLGYGDLGCYGQTKTKTPYIDSLASQGMKFIQHYAGSTVCMPSRASLLTGMHTGHSTVRGNPAWTNSGNPVDLKPEDVTIAEELKRAGYKTGVIGKWGLAEAKDTSNSNMPSGQGFDYFFGYKKHLHAHHYYYDTLYKNNDLFLLEGNDFEKKEGQYTHDLFTEEALDFINRSKNDPFFLYIAYTIPHLEMTVPEDSKQQYLNLGWPERKMNSKGHYKNDPEGHTTYAGMVSRMDRDIGKIIETLKQNGIDKNTLVIFTSDNGHEFDRNFFDSNGPLRGKKRDLYEGGIRVPFIAWWPGKVAAGSVTDHISAFWDILPTACDLAGIESTVETDGISLMPTLLGNNKKQEKHEYLYWEFNEKKGPVQAVRKDEWKLVKFKDKKAELYNLSEDIGEKNDIADANPEKVTELLEILEKSRTYHPEFTLEPVERMLEWIENMKKKNKKKKK